MQKNESWQGLPYKPISQHYKQVFGDKVYKIPVTVSGTCPNREGLKGMKTCNFCDAWGSAAYPDLQKEALESQINTAKARVLTRVNAGHFLVYFQAYTTTFQKVAKLREYFEVAIAQKNIVGVVLGTRPDCLSDALFDLLNEYSEKFYVAIELGVQTFNEEALVWMRRGHTAVQSRKAILKLREKCPKVNLGIHLMFGLPNEAAEDMVKAANECNALPIDNVKLHNLHVLKNTPLEQEYRRGEFAPIEREIYAERVRIFLQHLSPNIYVHRLAALSSRSEELIDSPWTAKKMETYQYMLDQMSAKQSFQGQHFTV